MGEAARPIVAERNRADDASPRDEITLESERHAAGDQQQIAGGDVGEVLVEVRGARDRTRRGPLSRPERSPSLDDRRGRRRPCLGVGRIS
jgi:hypothetical protein